MLRVKNLILSWGVSIPDINEAVIVSIGHNQDDKKLVDLIVKDVGEKAHRKKIN